MRHLASVPAIIVFASAALADTAPTFSKDVAPILYNRCIECHRPGEAGPMPLRTYKEARPWAKAIKEAVASRTMPPWMADPKANHFKTDRHLSVEQFSDMLIVYAPGVPTITFDPDTAHLVKAGSKLLFQVQSTTNGKEALDRSILGLKIRKDKPTYRAFSGSATQFRLNIPPNDPNYEAKATYTFREDVTLLDFTPHMHLRGKAFKYVMTYPDGRVEELLNVPKYDFNWQLSYILAEPRQVPGGSKVDVTAWYDNSANNKYNPDPTQNVKWGDQTFQEMMIGFFNYKVPVDRPEPPKVQQPARTGTGNAQ